MHCTRIVSHTLTLAFITDPATCSRRKTPRKFSSLESESGDDPEYVSSRDALHETQQMLERHWDPDRRTLEQELVVENQEKTRAGSGSSGQWLSFGGELPGAVEAFAGHTGTPGKLPIYILHVQWSL